MPIFFLERDYDMILQASSPVRFSDKPFGTMRDPRVHIQLVCLPKCLV